MIKYTVPLSIEQGLSKINQLKAQIHTCDREITQLKARATSEFIPDFNQKRRNLAQIRVAANDELTFLKSWLRDERQKRDGETIAYRDERRTTRGYIKYAAVTNLETITDVGIVDAMLRLFDTYRDREIVAYGRSMALTDSEKIVLSMARQYITQRLNEADLS